MVNFLIIGAQKSGTTSLADALNRHSQVFVCEPMEPEYFSGLLTPSERSLSRGDYEALFSTAPKECVRGEASTGTMLAEETISHLEEIAPEAKLIALLRNPEKRAYSAYTHDCKKGRVTVEEQKTIFRREAEAYLAGEKTRFDWFTRSEYARQLKSFSDRYGDRLKVVIFEELVANQEEGLQAIQEFLGLAVERLSLTRENRSRVPRSALAEKGIALGRKVVGPVRSLMSERGYRHFRETLMARLGKSPEPLDEDLSQRLRNERYRQEIQKLEKILGRNIEIW
jgi:hypothetical protein